MDVLRLGRILRMVRLRRGWRLRDVAARSHLSIASLGRHELGIIGSTPSLERHAASLDLRLEVRLVGRGADIARLADDEHASIVNGLAASYQGAGWLVRAEVSYSEWGERGRIDLLAHQASGPRLVVVEVKTELGDLQELLGTLDAKVRLAPTVARRLGWLAREVNVTLALASTSRNRRVVSDHAALFTTFRPRIFRGGSPAPRARRELLWVPPAAFGRERWLAGRQQVRRKTGDASRS